VSASQEVSTHAQAGDLVVITGHRVGEAQRLGEILEVLGEPSHERYRVQWDDGHESLFTPGSDAVIRHTTHAKPRRRKP
jgi:hypothetical protein